ncbi:MAG: type 4a pilus biogenesis protein PilO [Candidatus Omnitrophota bacterium]
MARPPARKQATPLDDYLNLAIKHSPILAPILVVILGIAVLIWPSYQKLSTIKASIKEKQDILTMVDRSSADVSKMQKELEIFKNKVVEFETRLPKRIKTNLIIETLQEITEKASLKFSSLEPTTIRKHVIAETNDTFVELPIRVRLRCGYYEMVNFLKKIETAKQLMKISDLVIIDDPAADWDHGIEFTISAFSRGENGD